MTQRHEAVFAAEMHALVVALSRFHLCCRTSTVQPEGAEMEGYRLSKNSGLLAISPRHFSGNLAGMCFKVREATVVSFPGLTLFECLCWVSYWNYCAGDRETTAKCLSCTARMKGRLRVCCCKAVTVIYGC